MESYSELIPLRIALLILGYFMQTLSGAEQIELDDWVTPSMENQKLFEDCVEMAKRPVQPNTSDDERTTRYMAALIVKEINQSITVKEKKILDKWMGASAIPHVFFEGLPRTDSIELLYALLRMRLLQEKYRGHLN